MNIFEKLLNIQSELKAPKNQYNNFGKYKYRSCEDILEAVKPICIKNKATLVLSDEIVYLGDRFYVKATAMLIDTEKGDQVQNTAYAREEESKKGMDSSQITGTASSYARKYALNGLFNIDDTKDADTDEFKNQTTRENTQNIENPYVTKAEAIACYKLMTKKGLNVVEQLKSNYGIDNTEKLTKEQYLSIVKAVTPMPDKE
jgi:hypothetical protein